MLSVEKMFAPKKNPQRREREEIEEGILEHEARKDKSNDLVSKELFSSDKFLEKNGTESADSIYEWYAKAMQRRDREPLGKDSFINHFFEGGSLDNPFMFGDKEKGYLLGYSKYGVFIPTHFAPKSLRTGVELIQKLGRSKETPCVMAITEDLVETITKMPEWHSVDMGFLAMFRSSTLKKKIVHNEHPEVRNLMLGLLEEYLKEASSLSPEDEAEDDDEDYYGDGSDAADDEND